jgi:hypothetical protein
MSPNVINMIAIMAHVPMNAIHSCMKFEARNPSFLGSSKPKAAALARLFVELLVTRICRI